MRVSCDAEPAAVAGQGMGQSCCCSRDSEGASEQGLARVSRTLAEMYSSHVDQQLFRTLISYVHDLSSSNLMDITFYCSNCVDMPS